MYLTSETDHQMIIKCLGISDIAILSEIDNAVSTKYTLEINVMFTKLLFFIMSHWSKEILIFVTEKYFTLNGSWIAARRAYMKHFNIKNKKDAPSRRVIQTAVKNFRETGCVKKKKCRKRTVRIPENIEAISEKIDSNPTKSLRKLSQEVNLSYGSTRRIMRYDLSLFPYKIQVGHKLLPSDAIKRKEFCKWFLEKCKDNRFLSHLVMSDEAHFYLDGVVNKQNCRIWASENPEVYTEHGPHGPRVTVWCGVTMRGIIGPYFFEDDNGLTVNVNGERYRYMLEHFVIPKLTELKLSRGVWFQQDGATCHTSILSMAFLCNKFKGRLISKKGDVPWPPRSPDLTVPDFYLWGHLKGLVYKDNPKNTNELKRAINREINNIPSDILKSVFLHLPSRMEECIKVNGSHLKNVIFKK